MANPTFDTSDFTPDSTAPTKFDTSDFQPDAAPQGPQTSAMEAGIRGFANSASFGIGKWVNGVVDATHNAVLNVAGSTDAAGMSAGNDRGFVQNVLDSVNREKANNATAMNEHPVAYIAGSLAPAVITGGAGLTKAATMGAMPTSLFGQTALGASTGAVTGAAESTNAHDLAVNSGTGAVLGSGLTLGLNGLVKIGSALANTQGDKALGSTINGLIEDATNGTGDAANAALQKLRQVYGAARDDFGQLTGKQWTKEQLLKQATNDQANLLNPSVNGKLNSTQTASNLNQAQSVIAKQMAPTGGQILKDAVNVGTAAVPGAVLGSVLGQTPGGIAGLGAATALPAIKKFGADVANNATMHYAASPAAQQFVQRGTQMSPLAVGPGVGQDPLGLSGVIGQYIDSTWRK